VVRLGLGVVLLGESSFDCVIDAVGFMAEDVVLDRIDLFSDLGFADGSGALSLLASGDPRDGDGRSGGHGDLDRAGDPAGPGDHVRFSLHRALRPASRMRRYGLEEDARWDTG